MVDYLQQQKNKQMWNFLVFEMFGFCIFVFFFFAVKLFPGWRMELSVKIQLLEEL